MRERSHNGSKLFLTELMIAIFFFAVVTAVCVQLFAEAHIMSVRSEALTQSVNAAANVAECYTVWDWQKESWEALFPEGSWVGETWQQSYDEAWQPCHEAGSYLLEMKVEQVGAFREAQIAVTDDRGQELYSLKTKRMYGE